MQHMVGVHVPDWKVKLIMREMLEPTQGCQEFFRQHVRRSFEILMRIVNLLLPKDTPEHRRIQIGLSIVSQCVHYRMARDVIRFLIPSRADPAFSPDSLAEHIVEFVFSALGLSPPFVRQWERNDCEYKEGTRVPG